MFIKLKQKKYQTKILSKKFSGFGIFNINLSFRFIKNLLKEWIPAFAGMTKKIFPSRKILLGVFLMVMIFGGIFGGIDEARAAYPAPTYSEGQHFGINEGFSTDEEAKVACDEAAVANNIEASTVNPNIPLLKCSREAPYYLKLSSSLDAATGTDFTEGALDVTGKAIGMVLEKIANIVLAIVYGICWLLLHLAGLFVDLSAVFLHATLDSALYNDMFKSNMVSEGWIIVRDVCNMFFILILLVISLATILRIQTYKAQSLLLPLLIAAFLVNFSRPIVELAIDASQILMYQFVNMMGGSFIDSDVNQKLSGITDTFIGAFGGFDKIGAIVKGDLINAASWVIAIMFALVFLLVLAAVYTAMALFMIIRLVALTILIIFSPLGFFFNILPQTKSYASKYWSELSKYLIFGPVMAFFIYLAGHLAISVPADLESRLTQIATENEVLAVSAEDGVLAANKVLTEGGAVLVSLLGELLPYVVIMVFLYAAIWIARQLGIWGADKVEGMTVGKAAVIGGFLGGAAGGLTSRWLAKGGRIPGVGRVSKKLQGKQGSGKIARLSRWTGKRVEGAAEKKQKMASMMSPEVWKKAYGNYVSDEESEAYGESSARLQDLMNRSTGKGKTNNAELARLAKIAEEQRKILSKNPKVIGKYVADAVKRGDGIRAEAGMREAAAGGDTDSVLEALNLKNTDKDYDTMMENVVEPLLGKRQTAILDSDIGQMEKANGNYAMWGRSGYDSKSDKWKRNSEEKWQEASAKKFSTTSGRQKWQNFDARTLMDEVAPGEFKLKNTGKKILKEELTEVDIQWIREAKTAELKKVKQDEEEVKKLSPWGVRLIQEIDKKLGPQTSKTATKVVNNKGSERKDESGTTPGMDVA